MGSINTTDFVCVKDLRDDTLIHVCVNVLLSGHGYFLGFVSHQILCLGQSLALLGCRRHC